MIQILHRARRRVPASSFAPSRPDQDDPACRAVRRITPAERETLLAAGWEYHGDKEHPWRHSRLREFYYAGDEAVELNWRLRAGLEVLGPAGSEPTGPASGRREDRLREREADGTLDEKHVWPL